MSFRIARPTGKLEEIRSFYGEVLGLDLLSSFYDHDGYSGFIFKVPESEVELEFINRGANDPVLPPSPENLLVWYFDNPLEWEKKIQHLEDQGLEAVESENPWWEGRAKTYEDPEGWRVVICRKDQAV